jgi:hypothetical protein
MRYLLVSALVCLLGLGSAAAAAAQPAGVLPGQLLLSIASNGDQYNFDIDCQPENTSTIQFSVTGNAIPVFGGFDGSFQEQGIVTLDATGHVATFSSTFTIYADDGSVVTGTKELDTSETAGIATGLCGAPDPGSCSASTSPIDLRYTATTTAGTETGTARHEGIDAYQATCGGATDGAFWEEFLATDDPPSEPTTLTLEPESAVNVVGERHTVTATLVDQYGDPVQDYSIRFSVSGAVTATGSCITDVLGQCGFTFEGAVFPGTATITACTDAHGDGSCEPAPTAIAAKEYILPPSTTGATTGGGRIDTATVSVSVRSDGIAVSGDCTIVAATTTIDCLDAIAYVQAGSTSIIYGHATLNGVETLYRIRVVDVGDSGSRRDVFSIVTASGYELTGTLTFGNLQVH